MTPTFSLIDYDTNCDLEELDEELQDALESLEYTTVEEILSRPLNDAGDRLRPSPESLWAAIYSEMHHVYSKLLGSPYKIKPNFDCFNTAVQQRNHRLIYHIALTFPSVIAEFEDDAPMGAAIRNADYEIVEFMVDHLNFDVHNELFFYISDTPGSDDPFDIHTRRQYNRRIRDFLTLKLAEQQIEDEIIEQREARC